MTKIIATFSNGHQDVYKGSRPVKAAWAIIEKATGKVLNSGHSLDRVKAQKTAENNVRYAIRDNDRFTIYMPRGSWTPACHKSIAETARKYTAWDGKTNLKRFLQAHNASVNAAKRALVTIEVVDLGPQAGDPGPKGLQDMFKI